MGRHEHFADFSDGDLTAFVRQGDPDAFVELAARYMFLVRGKASAFQGSGLDADDLCQEGLVGLYAAAKSYDPGASASFRTYAGVCVLNRIIMAYRKAASGKNRPLNDSVSLDEEAVDTSNVSTNPENVVMDGEGLRSLKTRIKQSLSEMEQSVLSLYLSGCSYEEIAGRLGITDKAADNAMQRVRRKLKAPF